MPLHDGCITGKLTQEEENEVTIWLLGSFEERPEDWQFGRYVCADRKTGIEVWTSNGQDYLSVYKPKTEDFCKENQRKIWRALHKMRHENPQSTEVGLALAKIMAEHPAPPPTPEPPPLLRLTFMQRIIMFFIRAPQPRRLLTDQRALDKAP